MSPLLIFFVCISIYPHAAVTKTIKTPQDEHENKNLYELLASIEKHLAKIDENLHTSKYNSDVLELAERKCDKLDTTLKQYEENIKGTGEDGYIKNPNELITRIDTICERTQHRLMHLEMKIEGAEKKLTEKFDILMARFDKMEDTLTTRESDIEEQVGEVLSVVEELKTPIDPPVTDLVFKKNTEALQKINDKLDEIKESVQNREEIGEDLQADVRQMANVLNLTRNEQRNSFRNVIVQVGRIGGKNLVCNSNLEVDHLKELNETIHANLENVITLQNFFLESCHRIQLDEEQIEAKISEVLEKLIDALQQQDLEKNFKSMEQLLKVHDANIRRNMFSNTHNIGVLFQKDKKTRDDYKIQLEKIDTAVGEIKEKLSQAAILKNSYSPDNKLGNLCIALTGKGLEHIDNIKKDNKTIKAKPDPDDTLTQTPTTDSTKPTS